MDPDVAFALHGFVKNERGNWVLRNHPGASIPIKQPWPKKTDEKVREARRAEMGRLRAKIANKEKAENKPSENISD